jgi:hypothetical protein
MQGSMSLTESQIKQVEKDMNHLHSEVMRLFLLRGNSDVSRAEWSKACESWHKYKASTSFLWSKEFKESIKRNDETAISDAILFLEIDPYYFRSGYLKERLIVLLKSVDLNRRNKNRVLECFGKILKNAFWRRETRYYFSLVAKNFSEEYLTNFIDESNPPKNRKLKYLKRYLEHYYASNK